MFFELSSLSTATLDWLREKTSSLIRSFYLIAIIVTQPTCLASDLSNSANTGYDPGYDTSGQYISTITSAPGHEPPIASVTPGTPTPEANGDYDDSLPDLFPGPLINKPDEGAVQKAGIANSIPYYANTVQTTGAGLGGVDTNPDGGAYFSPNRMMPSPGMFGSLPSGIMAGKPWQTLLFRPQPAHPGAASPSDHLLLDLFWMPVVEPYAISDRFSTAGKINMNYQILPFTYMTRSTGINALFKSEMVMAIPNTVITKYKVPIALGGGTATPLRNVIDSAQTLAEFQANLMVEMSLNRRRRFAMSISFQLGKPMRPSQTRRAVLVHSGKIMRSQGTMSASVSIRLFTRA